MDRSRIVQDCERISQDPARITQRGTLAVQNMLCFRKALEASMAKVSALMSLSMLALSGVQDVCVVFLNSLLLQRKSKTRTELDAWVVVFLASACLDCCDPQAYRVRSNQRTAPRSRTVCKNASRCAPRLRKRDRCHAMLFGRARRPTDAPRSQHHLRKLALPIEVDVQLALPTCPLTRR